MRKHNYLTIFSTIILIIVMSFPVMADININSISITGSKTVYVGNTVELDSHISPSYLDLADNQYTWTSSNPSVAKVLVKNDDDTKIKGIKAGTATITVKINSTNIKATYKVTVKKEKVSTSAATAKIKKYKKNASKIKKDIKNTKLASTSANRRVQYYKFVTRIKNLENKLDTLENTWERKYKNGKISASKYHSIELKIEQVEDYLDVVEDYLDQKFSYEFDD